MLVNEVRSFVVSVRRMRPPEAALRAPMDMPSHVGCEGEEQIADLWGECNTRLYQRRGGMRHSTGGMRAVTRAVTRAGGEGGNDVGSVW